MKKAKKIIITLITMFLILILSISLYVIVIISQLDKNQMLDLNKLDTINSQIKLYDNQNNELVTTSCLGTKTVSLKELPEFVPQAFISIEDKKFYSHHGINIMRILKAGINNITSGYAKEGASTITQQLIKNTHLHNEKTLKRKIQEAYLSLKLEQHYTKEQILETYLNVIYFGNSAYGIESAAQTYFNKPAKELTLAESATLAGLIKSPKNYSPIHSKTNCLKRRNLVLKNMYEDNYISEKVYKFVSQTPLEVSATKDFSFHYNQQVLTQASKILNLSEKDISNSGLKIYTTLDKTLNDNLSKFYNSNIENSIIVIDNKTNNVLAYLGNNTQKRQAGSTLKPILCYAPAFEKGILSPITPINDEEINFSGYSPKNANNKYLGWTDVRTSLAKSLNIPAVKTLEYLGIENAKNYAQKLGLNFSPQDNHLAMALGATQEGFSMETIANAYTTFANNGQYSDLNFIKEIRNNKNEIIYKSTQTKKQALSPETCFLVNNILKDTTSIGTAKKLSSLNIPLSAKTGTVGSPTDSSNTDAWCVSFNPNFTVLSWFGNTSGKSENNLTQSQNGGTIATEQNLKIWKTITKQFPTQIDFNKPDNIVKCNIDALSLEQHKVELASTSTPEKYIVSDYFNKLYIPKTTSNNFTIITTPTLAITTDDKNLTFTFEGLEYLNYELIQSINGKSQTITKIEGTNKTLSYTMPKPTEPSEFFLNTTFKTSTKNTLKTSNIIKYIPTENSHKSDSSSTISKIFKKW